jgi:hypothetical protein
MSKKWDTEARRNEASFSGVPPDKLASMRWGPIMERRKPGMSKPDNS